MAIGIDLGTTNSVMCKKNMNVKEIFNKESEPITRSAVGYYKGQIIVGSPAIDRMVQDPENTIISIKRLMGRAYSDPDVQRAKERYHFEIRSPTGGSDDDLRVVLGGKEYSPVEISAMILKKLKEDAEEYLKDKVEYATITVPAYFSDKQREATRLAGQKAGLKVQKIIDEPSAAAIAFSVDHVGKDDTKTIIVYDFGGGTFDVCVMTIAGGVCAQLCKEGNMWLGGDDFDHKIMDYVVDNVKKEYGGIDASKNLRFMMELKVKAEKAKIALTSMRKTDIIVPGLLKDPDENLIDVEVELSIEQFERMIGKEVKDSIEIVKKAMKNAKITSEQVDHVLLVGGSSTIPMVQRALKDTFGEEKILKNIDPMKCVAYGAAIMANKFGENIECPECETINESTAEKCIKCGKELEKNDILFDITGQHYGIQTLGDKFEVIIPKGTPYPTEKHLYKPFKTPSSNLRKIKVPIYAGMDVKASKNEKQLTVWLALPKNTPEDTLLDVGFKIDDNGIISLIKLKLRLRDGSGTDKEVIVDSISNPDESFRDYIDLLKSYDNKKEKTKAEELLKSAGFEKCFMKSYTNNTRNNLTNLSYIVQKVNNIQEVIFPKGSHFPSSLPKLIIFNVYAEKTITFPVYACSNEKENRLLRVFNVNIHLPEHSISNKEIEVFFNLDENGHISSNIIAKFKDSSDVLKVTLYLIKNKIET